MPEIQYLPIFPTILTLLRSTDINVHLPTGFGADDGIFGSIMLVPTATVLSSVTVAESYD
ncbi:hypothetical protein SAMN06273570_1226 [Candidatus Pantoea floridensis]|uniref:Uncharacterized protein n=1 Tax=Candidatus Pantoea floridensis TaxID=1938870 RepID=A0A286BS14_9GAMM|nr:hypothetical protein BX596_2903 [Enterobacteriaceae bacterium JKS000233]SOD36908.1 hypothetical protein SAMN06273570_1226 [Pantoea floridensis]